MPNDEEKESLYLCMGSACHRLGVYEILEKLQALMAAMNLEDRVVLKGHFCLDNCSEGVIIKVRDRHFLNIRPSNVEAMFREEIVPFLLHSDASPEDAPPCACATEATEATP